MMRTTKRAMISVVVSTLIVLLSATSGQAALITFNSRAMFDAAAPDDLCWPAEQPCGDRLFRDRPVATQRDTQMLIFRPTNQLVGSSLIAVPTGGLFSGFSGAGTIGRINIAGQTHALGESVDNLAFGRPASALVPESSTLMLVGIGLLAAAFSGRRYFRVRSKRPESPLNARVNAAVSETLHNATLQAERFPRKSPRD